MASKCDDKQVKRKPVVKTEAPDDDSIRGDPTDSSRVKWALHVINVHQGDSILVEIKGDEGKKGCHTMYM